MQLDDAASSGAVRASHGVLICLLGSFRVVKLGRTVPFRAGGKAEALLTSLALRDRHHAPREALLDSLWPESDLARASRSLSTLVHDLRTLLGDALAGRSPVTPADGGYELNVDAGIRIDIREFDALVSRGDRHKRAGDVATAIRSYEAALQFYRGDVCSVRDVRAIVERERTRACYLSLLGYLADHHFKAADYPTALHHAVRLLLHDPCREDAHRAGDALPRAPGRARPGAAAVPDLSGDPGAGVRRPPGAGHDGVVRPHPYRPGQRLTEHSAEVDRDPRPRLIRS